MALELDIRSGSVRQKDLGEFAHYIQVVKYLTPRSEYVDTPVQEVVTENVSASMPSAPVATLYLYTTKLHR